MSQLEAIELPGVTPLPVSPSAIEYSNSNDSNVHQVLTNESALAPPDRGFQAWSFLMAAFLVEGLVWGFPTAYGVFLDGYLRDPKYAEQRHATSLLPLIGTVSSGIIYCSGPVMFPFIGRFPHYRRYCVRTGTIICWLSLFSASYTNNAIVLVFLQGILYAIGAILVYTPCLSYIPEWFVERRGLANGIVFAGTAAGGFVVPLVLPHLVSSYGPAKSLRILSIFIVCALLPLLPFLKGRIPNVRSRVRGPGPRGSGRGWIKNRLFWILIVMNTLQGFAYFLPIIWLPTFASGLQLSSSNAALSLALLNGTSVFGRLSMGYLSDRVNPWSLAVSTLFLTSLVTFILWGVASSTFGGLLAFGISYGIFAGGFFSLWSGFLKPIAKDDPALLTTLLGYLAFTSGIGNIVCTPIATALSTIPTYSTSFHSRTGFQVEGGRFEKLILYVGACFAGAGGIGVLGWIVDVRTQRILGRSPHQG